MTATVQRAVAAYGVFSLVAFLIVLRWAMRHPCGDIPIGCVVRIGVSVIGAALALVPASGVRAFRKGSPVPHGIRWLVASAAAIVAHVVILLILVSL